MKANGTKESLTAKAFTKKTKNDLRAGGTPTSTLAMGMILIIHLN